PDPSWRCQLNVPSCRNHSYMIDRLLARLLSWRPAGNPCGPLYQLHHPGWRDERPTREHALGGTHAMWQVYAMMAKDQIDEQLHDAELRRLGNEVPPGPRGRHRIHLPSMHRRRVR